MILDLHKSSIHYSITQILMHINYSCILLWNHITNNLIYNSHKHYLRYNNLLKDISLYNLLLIKTKNLNKHYITHSINHIPYNYLYILYSFLNLNNNLLNMMYIYHYLYMINNFKDNIFHLHYDNSKDIIKYIGYQQ